MTVRKKRLLFFLGLVLLLGVACAVFFGFHYHAAPEAAALLQGSDKVQVTALDRGWFLDGPGSRDALVFYPGGQVEATAYLPLLTALAEGGADCFLVKMPLNLAVFDMDAAASIQNAYTYDRWFVGGHSLGGACAALYAARHPDRLSGLILLAAYATQPLSDGLAVLELHGSEDLVLNRAKLEQGRQCLPASARAYELPGGNHAQFGDYGPQKGDGVPTVSRQDQTAWAAACILSFLRGE